MAETVINKSKLFMIFSEDLVFPLNIHVQNVIKLIHPYKSFKPIYDSDMERGCTLFCVIIVMKVLATKMHTEPTQRAPHGSAVYAIEASAKQASTTTVNSLTSDCHKSSASFASET